LQSNGFHTVTENTEESSKPNKDITSLKDFTSSTRLYEYGTINSRSIYVTINEIDISDSKQILEEADDGTLQLKILGVKVNYATYSPGVALTHEVSSQTVV
jgi:hypothetical protein